MSRTSIAVLVLAGLLASCEQEPALVRQTRKTSLVHAMSDALLASVAAEKSAVLATTDEESTAFAAEARKQSGELARLRDQLQAMITADGRPGEVEKLAAFDRSWSELRDVDERLLALAVKNSNLKAAWIAAGESTAALDRLLDALVAIELATDDVALVRELGSASVAALRIQTSLAPHIASKDEGEMARLEGRIKTLGERVDQGLAAARSRAPAAAQPQVDAAVAAFADYRRTTDEVVRLSRLNTNVVSVDVSVHEKQRVTDACRAALAALLDEIHGGPEPRR